MSFIESGHSGIVMDKIRRGLTTSHIGFVYEDICQERMWELPGAGGGGAAAPRQSRQGLPPAEAGEAGDEDTAGGQDRPVSG